LEHEEHKQDHVARLAAKVNSDWPSVRQAAESARDMLAKFRKAVLTNGRLAPETEVSVVVFGSLARGEWTSGSDVDWTLLIDGPADPEHRSIAHIVGQRLDAAGLQKPGQAGVFGNMAFSHDIVHRIGGQSDTNANMTQRILLLLESCPVLYADAHDHVLRCVLHRYLEDDVSFLSSSGKGHAYKIPRFLLNDIVRFWRTMAVDYAHKRYERAGKGWAIRNIKLRMSRKLIFVAGLLTCFSCYLNPSEEVKVVFSGLLDSKKALVNHLMAYVRMTPLEVLAEACERLAAAATAQRIFDAYDAFLKRLSDPEVRDHLNNLPLSEADADGIFNELCRISREFQGGLTSLFFDENAQMNDLIRKYGVF
jgi:hypothetical protein